MAPCGDRFGVLSTQCVNARITRRRAIDLGTDGKERERFEESPLQYAHALLLDFPADGGDVQRQIGDNLQPLAFLAKAQNRGNGFVEVYPGADIEEGGAPGSLPVSVLPSVSIRKYLRRLRVVCDACPAHRRLLWAAVDKRGPDQITGEIAKALNGLEHLRAKARRRREGDRERPETVSQSSGATPGGRAR